jgi:hypothetical protein
MQKRTAEMESLLERIRASLRDIPTQVELLTLEDGQIEDRSWLAAGPGEGMQRMRIL